MKLVVVLALLIAQLAQAQRGKLFKTTPAPPVEAKEAPSSSILNNKVNAECQQNEMMNRLLLQLLVSSVSVTTQNPLVANLNRLLNPGAAGPVAGPGAPGQPQQTTRVVTSTAINTVTQLFSTVISVIFKNSKIPTTIYSSDVVVVTELVTETVTVPLSSEPTAQVPLSLFRQKREEVEIPDQDDDVMRNNEVTIESSLSTTFDSSQTDIQPTRPLLSTDRGYSEEDIHRLISALNHPQVRQLWDQLTQVLRNVIV